MPIKVASVQGTLNKDVNGFLVASVQGTVNKTVEKGTLAPSQGLITKVFWEDWILTSGTILSSSQGSGSVTTSGRTLSPSLLTDDIRPVTVTMSGEFYNLVPYTSTVGFELSYWNGSTYVVYDTLFGTTNGLTPKVISKTFTVSGVDTKGLRYRFYRYSGDSSLTASYTTGKCTAWYERG